MVRMYIQYYLTQPYRRLVLRGPQKLRTDRMKSKPRRELPTQGKHEVPAIDRNDFGLVYPQYGRGVARRTRISHRTRAPIEGMQPFGQPFRPLIPVSATAKIKAWFVYCWGRHRSGSAGKHRWSMYERSGWREFVVPPKRKRDRSLTVHDVCLVGLRYKQKKQQRTPQKITGIPWSDAFTACIPNAGLVGSCSGGEQGVADELRANRGTMNDM